MLADGILHTTNPTDVWNAFYPNISSQIVCFHPQATDIENIHKAYEKLRLHLTGGNDQVPHISCNIKATNINDSGKIYGAQKGSKELVHELFSAFSIATKGCFDSRHALLGCTIKHAFNGPEWHKDVRRITATLAVHSPKLTTLFRHSGKQGAFPPNTIPFMGPEFIHASPNGVRPIL